MPQRVIQKTCNICGSNSYVMKGNHQYVDPINHMACRVLKYRCGYCGDRHEIIKIRPSQSLLRPPTAPPVHNDGTINNPNSIPTPVIKPWQGGAITGEKAMSPTELVNAVVNMHVPIDPIDNFRSPALFQDNCDKAVLSDIFRITSETILRQASASVLPLIRFKIGPKEEPKLVKLHEYKCEEGYRGSIPHKKGGVTTFTHVYDEETKLDPDRFWKATQDISKH